MFPGWAELQALATNSSGGQGMPMVMVLTSGAGVTDALGVGSLPRGPKPLGHCGRRSGCTGRWTFRLRTPNP